jgi:hypothetical protein
VITFIQLLFILKKKHNQRQSDKFIFYAKMFQFQFPVQILILEKKRSSLHPTKNGGRERQASLGGRAVIAALSVDTFAGDEGDADVAEAEHVAKQTLEAHAGQGSCRSCKGIFFLFSDMMNFTFAQ